jgi:hypothetical protein
MRPHRVLGSAMNFLNAMSEPDGRKLNSAARLLMPSELTHEKNRVVKVNSEIFNSCKYCTVTIQPFHSVPVLFIASFYCSTFAHSVLCSVQFFCLTIQCFAVYFLF